MRDNVNLEPIIQKLGHSIQEIRRGSLHSILSKLENNIIRLDDLIKEELIFVKLLEWFNFEGKTDHEKVLKLLVTLTQNKKAVKLLKGIGAIPFFVSFREDVHPNLQPLTDQLLDKLSHVEETHAESVKTLIHDQLDSEEDLEYPKDIFIQQEVADKRSSRNISEEHYFSSNTSHVQELSTEASFPENEGLPLTILPWQFLCEADKQVLQSVTESLGNGDNIEVMTACEFFMEVLLDDFPAEVFLQRPAIVKLFLQIIKSVQETKYPICILAVNSLQELACALLTRLSYFLDPVNYALKQMSSMPDSILSLESKDLYIPFQDRDRKDSQNSSFLFHQQMTLPQFCTSVLNTTLLLMTTEEDSLKNASFFLLERILQLMEVCIKPAIISDRSPAAKDTCEEIIEAMKVLGDVLNHFCSRCESSVGNLEMITLYRASYVQMLGVTGKILDVIYSGQEDFVTMPKNLSHAVAVAIFDPFLVYFFSPVHHTIRKYVRETVKNAYDTFETTWEVCLSMKATGDFLKNYNKANESSSLIHVASECVLSLPFHMNADVVKACFYMEAIQCPNWNLSPEEERKAEKLTLKLLAHSDIGIRKFAYEACASHVKETLSVQQASNVALTQASQVQFLINSKILSEILVFGLQDESEQIRRHSEEIFIYLLKGKWLMKPRQWEKLVNETMPLLPLLQCYADMETGLGRLIVGLLDVEGKFLPTLELLRGNLRLMFSPNYAVREEALIRLIAILCKEEKSYLKLPSLSSISSVLQNNLLLTDSPLDIKKKKDYIPIYQAANLLKVLELVQSKDIDIDVRRSSVNQISIMLEDPNLHETFLEYNGLQVILQLLEDALMEEKYEFSPDCIPPILKSLHSTAFHVPSTRHQLASDTTTCMNIVRSLLLFRSDDRLVQETSRLLTLLLFDELILATPEYNQSASAPWYRISLPHIITERLRLPFTCHTHWVVSPNLESQVTLDETWPFMDLLKISWNRAWFGNLDEVLEWKDIPHCPQFSLAVHLTQRDKTIFEASYPHLICRRLLFDIQNATTHNSVKESLVRLTHQILMFSYFKNICVVAKDIFLPWSETLSRFFTVFPASLHDEELLCNIVEFLSNSLKWLPEEMRKEIRQWLCTVLKDHKHVLYTVIRRGQSRWPLTGQGLEKLQDRELHSQLLTQVVNLAEELVRVTEQEDTYFMWKSVLLKMMGMKLQELCMEPHSHIASINLILKPIIHLTVCLGWSGKIEEVNASDFCCHLLPLCDAATCMQKVGENQQFSFLGRGLSLKIAICLCHVSAEMSTFFGGKNWVHLWMSSEETSSLLWLSLFWSHRDSTIRAAALQIITVLTMMPQGHKFVAQQFQDLEGGLWGLAFRFLLDPFEPSIVREKAALLMVNLTRNVTAKSEVGEDYWNAPVLINPQTKKITSGVQALMMSLEQNYFYREILLLLKSYSALPFMDPSVLTSLSLTIMEKQKFSEDHLDGNESIKTLLLIPGEHYSSGLYSGDENGPIIRDIKNGTPNVVSNMCLLLENLACLDLPTLTQRLKEYHIVESLLKCVEELPSSERDAKSQWLKRCIIYLCTRAASLLTMCSMQDVQVRQSVLENEKCLEVVFTLLDPDNYDSSEEQMRNELWVELLGLLTIVLKDVKPKDLESFCALLSDGWSNYVQNCKLCLMVQSPPRLVMNSLQCLLSFILTVTVEPAESGSGYMNDIVSTDDADEVVSAQLFCKLLIRLYDTQDGLETNREKQQVMQTLGALLAVSERAKLEALEAGFLETLLLQMKDLHKQLKLETSTDRRKMQLTLSSLSCILTLMNSFVCECNEVKEAAAVSGLANLLHKMWTWFLTDQTILQAALHLLCSFTASHVAASQSMAFTTATPGASSRKSPSNASFIQAIVNVVKQETDKLAALQDIQTLQLALKVLGNSCCASECPEILSKSTILEPFRALHPRYTKKYRFRFILEYAWLEFLFNFSHSGGQVMIPRFPDVMANLIAMTEESSQENQHMSLSVLKNLALHPANRVRFLSSDVFIPVLTNKLANGSDHEKLEVVLIVWALVANYEKGKIYLKQTTIMQQLQRIAYMKDECLDKLQKELMRTSQIVLQLMNAAKGNR